MVAALKQTDWLTVRTYGQDSVNRAALMHEPTLRCIITKSVTSFDVWSWIGNWIGGESCTLWFVNKVIVVTDTVAGTHPNTILGYRLPSFEVRVTYSNQPLTWSPFPCEPWSWHTHMQKSPVSWFKDRVDTNGQTEAIALPRLLMRSAVNQRYCRDATAVTKFDKILEISGTLCINTNQYLAICTISLIIYVF